jgi:hypothetical protein
MSCLCRVSGWSAMKDEDLIIARELKRRLSELARLVDFRVFGSRALMWQQGIWKNNLSARLWSNPLFCHSVI